MEIVGATRSGDGPNSQQPFPIPITYGKHTSFQAASVLAGRRLVRPRGRPPGLAAIAGVRARGRH